MNSIKCTHIENQHEKGAICVAICKFTYWFNVQNSDGHVCTLSYMFLAQQEPLNFQHVCHFYVSGIYTVE